MTVVKTVRLTSLPSFSTFLTKLITVWLLLCVCVQSYSRFLSVNRPSDNRCMEYVISDESEWGCRKTRVIKYKFVSHPCEYIDRECIYIRDVPMISISKGLFDEFLKVRELVVECGGIEKVEAYALQALTGLKELRLNNNRLTSIHPTAFAALDSIEILVLSYNSLQSSAEATESMRNMTKLRTLDLSHNPLKTLDWDAFVKLELTKVEKLNISSCRIEEINEKALVPLAHLKELDLSHNLISSAGLFSALLGLWQAKLHILILNHMSGMSPFIPTEALSAVKNHLEILWMDFTQIHTIEIGDFPVMQRLHTLCISHANLSYIENLSLHHLPGLRRLILIDNRLTIIPTGLTVIPSLRIFDMSRPYDDNHTEETVHHYIDGKTTMPELTIFKLSGMRLRSIQEPFGKFVNLIRLDLSACSLRTIIDYAFVGIPRVETLLLSRNALLDLSNHTFFGLTLLQVLRLDHNKLEFHSTLMPFTQLVSLKELNLNDNRIAKLWHHTFAGLKSIQKLYLNGNKITRLKRNSRSAFGGLHSLQDLDLSNNEIKHIEEDVFANLTKLEFLNLTMNSIASWDANAFRMSIHLLTLDLSVNQINRFSQEMLDGLPQYHGHHLYVRFHQNPFDCCSIGDIQQWAENVSHVTRTLLSDVMCQKPAKLVGASITAVYYRAQACNYKWYSVGGLVTIVIMAIPTVGSIIGIIAYCIIFQRRQRLLWEEKQSNLVCTCHIHYPYKKTSLPASLHSRPIYNDEGDIITETAEERRKKLQHQSQSVHVTSV